MTYLTRCRHGVAVGEDLVAEKRRDDVELEVLEAAGAQQGHTPQHLSPLVLVVVLLQHLSYGRRTQERLEARPVEGDDLRLGDLV